MKKKGTRGKFLVDSCGWIEYLTDGKLAGRYAPFIEESNPDVSISSPIVTYEIFKKVKDGVGEESTIFNVLHIEHLTHVVDITPDLALKAADISLMEGMPMADAFIYATALSQGAFVVTGDRHFKGKDNVKFIT